MGKRIPKSNRHKKIKFVDPCYSGPSPRSKKRQFQANEPPRREDDQSMSYEMKEFIDLKNKSKHGKIKKRKRKKVMKDDFIIVKNQIVDKEQPGMTKPIKPLPSEVKQKKNETTGRFFNRLQKMADMALAEAKMEDKYNIELVNIDNHGNAQYRTDAKEVTENKKRKREKLKEKLSEKKKSKLDNGIFELKREKIQFGEVVSAPPIIKSKPGKAPASVKAGKKELILKGLFENKNKSKDTDSFPLTIKWKNIAPDRRKDLELERNRAVQIYRLMKRKKTP